MPRQKKHAGDEFRDWTLHALLWLKHNWKGALELAGVAILAIIVLFGARAYWRYTSESAAEKLYAAAQLEVQSAERQAELAELVERWPRTAAGKQAMMLLGDEYLQAQEYGKAQELFRELAGRSRNHPMLMIAALHRLAEAQIAAGDPGAAAETFMKAAADPHNRIALQSRLQAAACEELADNRDQAAALYRQIIDEAGEGDAAVKAESEERLLWLAAHGHLES